MRINTLTLAVAASLLSGATLAAGPKTDLGMREFRDSCAACHGMDGRAQTQMLDVLKTAPPDLRYLAKRNGGVFPLARVYEVIDGRLELKGHGTREMPVWGQRFAPQGAPVYDDYAYNPEAHARARILGVIDYIYRLQEK